MAHNLRKISVFKSQVGKTITIIITTLWPVKIVQYSNVHLVTHSVLTSLHVICGWFLSLTRPKGILKCSQHCTVRTAKVFAICAVWEACAGTVGGFPTSPGHQHHLGRFYTAPIHLPNSQRPLKATKVKVTDGRSSKVFTVHKKSQLGFVHWASLNTRPNNSSRQWVLSFQPFKPLGPWQVPEPLFSSCQ